MKISKERLKKLIFEELEAELNEREYSPNQKMLYNILHSLTKAQETFKSAGDPVLKKQLQNAVTAVSIAAHHLLKTKDQLKPLKPLPSPREPKPGEDRGHKLPKSLRNL